MPREHDRGGPEQGYGVADEEREQALGANEPAKQAESPERSEHRHAATDDEEEAAQIRESSLEHGGGEGRSAAQRDNDEEEGKLYSPPEGDQWE